MFKEVKYTITKSGEKELRAAGADKDMIADRLLKVVNSDNLPYKEVIQGMYRGKPCPHGLFIEKQCTGTYVTFMGFIGYVLFKDDILEVIDIQDMFKGLTWPKVDEVIEGASGKEFDIREVIKKRIRK